MGELGQLAVRELARRIDLVDKGGARAAEEGVELRLRAGEGGVGRVALGDELGSAKAEGVEGGARRAREDRRPGAHLVELVAQDWLLELGRALVDEELFVERSLVVALDLGQDRNLHLVDQRIAVVVDEEGIGLLRLDGVGVLGLEGADGGEIGAERRDWRCERRCQQRGEQKEVGMGELGVDVVERLVSVDGAGRCHEKGRYRKGKRWERVHLEKSVRAGAG
jgi:hypothetical protein